MEGARGKELPGESLPGAALDSLCLIQDHVMPLDTLEVFNVLDDKLVAGDEDVELTVHCMKEMLTPELTQDTTLLGVTPVRQNLHRQKGHQTYILLTNSTVNKSPITGKDSTQKYVL